ncbi:MAG TPA: hypothetical protein VHZ74_25550 [Bryobacteraceae bacterium]|nr:hypothetical protein [Bryobacteraceae bacterium]
MNYARMKNLILGCALVAGTAVLFVSPIAAQRGGRGGPPPPPAGPMPRLPDGHPDMQGFWNPPAITDIEPAPARGGGARGGAARGGGAPGGGAARGGPPGGGAAAAGFGFGGGGNRIIDPADGKIPYKPEARAKQEDILRNHMADEPELHCYESGIPHSESNQFGVQIIQTPGYLVQLSEFMHTVRIIPTDGRPHIDSKIKLFEGDPVGHWEGDTLVVDTTNQNTKTWFDTSGNFKTENLHVTEKFIPQDANTIVYEATITDPEIYTQPWTARWNINRNRTAKMSDGHPYEQMEFGCIEGNEDLQHYTEDKGGKAPKKR